MLSPTDLAHLIFELIPWPKSKPATVAIGVAALCLAIIVALLLLALS